VPHLSAARWHRQLLSFFPLRMFLGNVQDFERFSKLFFMQLEMFAG
jgi:hypothetical protein